LGSNSYHCHSNNHSRYRFHLLDNLLYIPINYSIYNISTIHRRLC